MGEAGRAEAKLTIPILGKDPNIFQAQPQYDSNHVDISDCHCKNGGAVIPAFDPATGALPPGDHRATLEEIESRFGFTPRRRWLLQGLRTAIGAFWSAGIQDIYIDGSFCTEKPDPGDVDGYWIEPNDGVYDRIDPYWIDF